MYKIISNIAFGIIVILVWFSGHFDTLFTPSEGVVAQGQEQELTCDQDKETKRAVKDSLTNVLWEAKATEFSQVLGDLMTDLECGTIADHPILSLFSSSKSQDSRWQHYHKRLRGVADQEENTNN